VDRRDIADALLDAADRVLQEEGFSALTKQKVAKLAGVSESTIPYYFIDKDGLLFAVVDRSLSFIEARLNSLMDIDPRSPTASLQFAETMIEAHHACPRIAQLMTSEQQRHSQSRIWQQHKKRRGPRTGILRGLGSMTRKGRVTR